MAHIGLKLPGSPESWIPDGTFFPMIPIKSLCTPASALFPPLYSFLIHVGFPKIAIYRLVLRAKTRDSFRLCIRALPLHQLVKKRRNPAPSADVREKCLRLRLSRASGSSIVVRDDLPKHLRIAARTFRGIS